MSGLEIVGIILGILPVLEKAAKASKVAEKVSFFRSFRSKFNDFLASILAALISYRQNIKFLLGPLGLEPEVVAELVDGPDKLGTWADPGFQSRLKSRFGDDEKLFGWLIGQLIEVKTIIDDLNTLLCNFVAEVSLWPFSSLLTKKLERFPLRSIEV